MDKTQEIKAAIEELLKSEEIDYSRFTTLSNELLKQDREHVRFSVDAGIINRLGKELVGRAETAISELKDGGDRYLFHGITKSVIINS